MGKWAVVVAVVLLAVACGDDGDDSSAEAEEAIAIAQEYVEARDSWDGEGMGALAAADAVIDGNVATAEEYLAEAEFERVTGRRHLDPECTATAVGPPVEVTCTYIMQNSWSEALGVGPFTGSSIEFVIADGQIQELTSDFVVTEFGRQVWSVYTAWLTETHPDDIDLVIDRVGTSDVPLITPEAVALWEQHTTEFAASQSES